LEKLVPLYKPIQCALSLPWVGWSHLLALVDLDCTLEIQDIRMMKDNGYRKKLYQLDLNYGRAEGTQID